MAADNTIDPELLARRDAIVREHMESENHHDFDTTIGTFSHPRYEIVPTGDVYDGEDAVRTYYEETRTAFPDQRNELISLRHADDAVIVEFDLLGTHLGWLRTLPPTGRSFRARMMALFIFEDDRIVCERVYFDQATILRQLGVSHDPTSTAGRISTAVSHPVTIGRALISAALSARR
jgi:steroid delta-isomerase-like uncharacterized protein